MVSDPIVELSPIIAATGNRQPIKRPPKEKPDEFIIRYFWNYRDIRLPDFGVGPISGLGRFRGWADSGVGPIPGLAASGVGRRRYSVPRFHAPSRVADGGASVRGMRRQSMMGFPPELNNRIELTPLTVGFHAYFCYSL